MGLGKYLQVGLKPYLVWGLALGGYKETSYFWVWGVGDSKKLSFGFGA